MNKQQNDNDMVLGIVEYTEENADKENRFILQQGSSRELLDFLLITKGKTSNKKVGNLNCRYYL
jgi:hypothetical protein